MKKKKLKMKERRSGQAQGNWNCNGFPSLWGKNETRIAPVFAKVLCRGRRINTNGDQATGASAYVCPWAISLGKVRWAWLDQKVLKVPAYGHPLLPKGFRLRLALARRDGEMGSPNWHMEPYRPGNARRSSTEINRSKPNSTHFNLLFKKNL